MATPRTNTRAMTQAREEILIQLIEDHKRVKKAYRDFQKLDPGTEADACQALVDQVLHELSVHAAVEEEILYPAAREAVEEDLINEAEVEHESLHRLIEQLQSMSASDEKFAACFNVLCEYVLHHVKEEEGEIFPQLRDGKLDWPLLAESITRRRKDLSATASDDKDSAGEDDDDSDSASAELFSGSRTAQGNGNTASRPQAQNDSSAESVRTSKAR